MAQEISLDEFAMDIGSTLYRLRMTIKDTMGDMVYLNGSKYMEVDSFIRNAEIDTKYYMGNVVLLH